MREPSASRKSVWAIGAGGEIEVSADREGCGAQPPSSRRRARVRMNTYVAEGMPEPGLRLSLEMALKRSAWLMRANEQTTPIRSDMPMSFAGIFRSDEG